MDPNFFYRLAGKEAAGFSLLWFETQNTLKLLNPYSPVNIFCAQQTTKTSLFFKCSKVPETEHVTFLPTDETAVLQNQLVCTIK
jgi:hypothetical protein